MMLFAPTLTDPSGTKISKSAHNNLELPIESLIAYARGPDGRRIEVSNIQDQRISKVSRG